MMTQEKLRMFLYFTDFYILHEETIAGIFGCSESNFVFSRDKRSIYLDLYTINSIRLCTDHFAPHVKK